MLVGPAATRAEREAFRAGIEAAPRELSSRSRRSRSAATRSSWRSSARRTSTSGRSFSTASRISVVPGGLTRAALAPGIARRQLLAGRREQGHLGAALMLEPRRRLALLDGTVRRACRGDRAGSCTSNFHALLDADQADRERPGGGCCSLGGADDLFREHLDEYTPRRSTEFLLWRPENPNAVVACIARARENARGASRPDLDRDVGAAQPVCTSTWRRVGSRG